MFPDQVSKRSEFIWHDDISGSKVCCQTETSAHWYSQSERAQTMLMR